MATRLQRNLQIETEYWLHFNKLTRFFCGVSNEIIDGKRYLLSVETCSVLVENGYIS